MTANIIKPELSPGKTGWLAFLDLQISRKGRKSVISRSSQQGPLTLQQPFYPENDEEVCHLYLLHPPAGIVGGDTLQLGVTVMDQGGALLTTPGATKFYRSKSKPARQIQQFSVAAGSSLEWLPQETIYFPNTHAQLQTQINLEDDGKFIGWEVHCLGLPAVGRNLEGGKVDISLSIRRGGTPLFIDSMRIREEKNRYPSAFLRSEPVFGSFIATHCNQAMVDLVRSEIESEGDGLWGATLVEDLLIVRYLGPSTNEAKNIFARTWQLVRPLILGRESKPPRIWAT